MCHQCFECLKVAIWWYAFPFQITSSLLHTKLACYIVTIDPNSGLCQTFAEIQTFCAEFQARKTCFKCPKFERGFLAPASWIEAPGLGSSLASTEAPFESKSSAASTWPSVAVWWSGVWPQAVFPFCRCGFPADDDWWMFWTQHLQICSKQKTITKYHKMSFLQYYRWWNDMWERVFQTFKRPATSMSSSPSMKLVDNLFWNRCTSPKKLWSLHIFLVESICAVMSYHVLLPDTLKEIHLIPCRPPSSMSPLIAGANSSVIVISLEVLIPKISKNTPTIEKPRFL